MVGAHHLDGARREDADAVELAAAAASSRRSGHSPPPSRTARRRRTPPSGTTVGSPRRFVGRRQRPDASSLCTSASRDSFSFGTKNAVSFIFERLEQPRAQEVAERLARELLDEVALHVDADAVGPARAGLRHQRHLRQPSIMACSGAVVLSTLAFDDHFVDRVVAGSRCSPGPP